MDVSVCHASVQIPHMSNKNNNSSYYEAAGRKKKQTVFVKHLHIIAKTATENLWGILSLLYSV